MNLETTDKNEKWTGKQIIILIGLWLAFLISFITRLVWATLMPVANSAMHLSVAKGNNYVTAFLYRLYFNSFTRR